MEKASLNMKMDIMQGNSSSGRNMEEVAISLGMGHPMKGIGEIIKDRVWECMYGQMVENILASGEKARWMGQECTNGRMEESIWDNIFKTVSQVMGSTYILMEECILAILKKVKCMG